MLKMLVEQPDKLSVEAAEDHTKTNTIKFVSKQDKNDIKRLIGKSGVNAQALRRWLTAVGARSDRRFIFDIEE
jgi:predicted RNA-binding protein YlqC (UPF0109 family)